MISRRKALIAALLPALWMGTGALPAQDIADLKTQLNSGLKCRRDLEFAFVALIVQMVDSGDLSVELVKGCFQYARKKKPYPFPYFERVIRVRAAEQGVTIP